MATLCLMTLPMASQEIVSGVKVNDARLERNGNYMSLDLRLDVSNLKVKRNRAVLLTPCVINGDDSLHLKSIGIYGRKRYYHYLRNNGSAMISGEDEMTYKKGSVPSIIEYHDMVPYQVWMNGSYGQLHRYLYGCCGNILAQESGLLGGWADPEFIYISPESEIKTRSHEGSAFIDFPVDKTTINPNYRNNQIELGKINSSIDLVKGDADVTINSIWLKGYASPESPYSHNSDLAKGRVKAIKDYVLGLYNFPEDMITTEYEPEDWADLRAFVETSSLEHKAEILDMIDSNLDPDQKEAKLKATYPEEYKYLLQNCYPALRHTDYKINYTVRGYNDLDEIRNIMHTEPGKLSLNELYLLAQTLEPGSEEFSEVFDMAVHLYPNDETANLNAANASLKARDYDKAEKYLEKAGQSGEAEYARGLYSYMMGDLDAAQEHFTNAESLGITQAEKMLEKIE